VVPTVPSNYWIYLLAAIFGPLQGFLNASIVFCRDRKSIQRRVAETTKKLRSSITKFRTKFTSFRVSTTDTGASKVVSVELAGDIETKRPFECSFNREKDAQLEIGVVQVERFEEEEKTPEAALNGEDNVPNEATLNSEANVPDEAALNGEGNVSDEDASNGEENLSDEVLDESDEGLLEHAMNSGLLNDDDRERFHKSVERIQRRSSYQ
jgi:hypothetical protein